MKRAYTQRYWGSTSMKNPISLQIHVWAKLMYLHIHFIWYMHLFWHRNLPCSTIIVLCSCALYVQAVLHSCMPTVSNHSFLPLVAEMNKNILTSPHHFFQQMSWSPPFLFLQSAVSLGADCWLARVRDCLTYEIDKEHKPWKICVSSFTATWYFACQAWTRSAIL